MRLNSSLYSVGGYSMFETPNHIFFNCSILSSIWSELVIMFNKLISSMSLHLIIYYQFNLLDILNRKNYGNHAIFRHLWCSDAAAYMNGLWNLYGSFDSYDRKTECDILIISCLNLMFDASNKWDKIDHFSILSWFVFVIFILIIGWVRNYPDSIRNSFIIMILCHY